MEHSSARRNITSGNHVLFPSGKDPVPVPVLAAGCGGYHPFAAGTDSGLGKCALLYPASGAGKAGDVAGAQYGALPCVPRSTMRQYPGTDERLPVLRQLRRGYRLL